MSSKLINFWGDDIIKDYLDSIPKGEKSEFIRLALHEKIKELSNPEEKLKKAKLLKEEGDSLEKQAIADREKIKEQCKKLYSSLTEAEMIYLNCSKKAIAKSEFLLNGKLKYYNNYFGKNLSTSNFKKILEDLKIPESLKKIPWEEKQ